MKVLSLLLFALAVAALAPAAARAGWFGSGGDQARPIDKSTSGRSSGGFFKTPKAVSSLADGTKRMVSNTTGMLSPKKTSTVRKSGTTAVKRAKSTKDEKPGFFKSLVNPDPPSPPKTIKEWMSLKQIHPGAAN